ncbi:MAG: hypothetical protein M3065_21895 [Actinomycetota bacterium]|nr:hypothetical protein [Actinomycetota bacterium]
MTGLLTVALLFGGGLVAGFLYQGLLATRRGQIATGALGLAVAGIAVAVAFSRHDVGYALLPVVLPVFVLAKAIDERSDHHRAALLVLGSSVLLLAIAAALIAAY